MSTATTEPLTQTVTLDADAYIDCLVVLNLAVADSYQRWMKNNESESCVRLRLRAYAALAGRPHPHEPMIDAAMLNRTATAA